MNEYQEAIKKMVWSYSRLTSFEHCKYEFYLNYIIHDNEQYLSEGNFYAELGNYVHEILAKIFKGELPTDDAAKYFIDNYEDNVFYKVKQSTMDKKFEACAEYFSDADFKWLNDYDILGVEMETEFEIEGYKFTGFIDLLLRDKKDGKIVILDNKSSDYPFKADGKVKANSEHSFSNYKKQMYLYAYAVKAMYGEFPKKFIWNHFCNNGRFAELPFSSKECEQTVKWALDLIHTIENETDYDASPDFFYCNNLCNFRNSCEYVLDSLPM